MRVKILGISIDPVTVDEAVARTLAMLEDGRQHYVVTPNPEMVVDAQHDQEFFHALAAADLAIPDGIGLVRASAYLKLSLKEKVSGVDYLVRVINALHNVRSPYTVAYVGGFDGVAERTKKRMLEEYPGARIIAATDGPIFKGIDDERATQELCAYINEQRPDILFLGLGHLLQEKWLHRNLMNIPSVKVAVGIGGAFDMLSGRIRRAPLFFQRHGIEWLWRFILEPKKRFRRIYKAVLLFSYEIFKSRF